MKNVIFYFSGTGNSKLVALDLCKYFEEAEVHNIGAYKGTLDDEVERIGFVFPVYFWGLPNIMKEFINKLNIKGNPYLFAIATCGEVPGASFKQINQKLKKKNKKLNSAYYIKMPNNYILMYKPPKEEKLKKFMNEEKAKVLRISNDVKEKRNMPYEKSGIVVDGIFGSMLNNFVVSKYKSKDKDFNVSEDCIGCSICEKVCNVNNITIVSGRPVWHHKCEFCLACLQYCPKKAINYKNETYNKERYVNPNINIE